MNITNKIGETTKKTDIATIKAKRGVYIYAGVSENLLRKFPIKVMTISDTGGSKTEIDRVKKFVPGLFSHNKRRGQIVSAIVSKVGVQNLGESVRFFLAYWRVV